ncbi:hypothetical protein COBT_001211 [Conglomerata obtusa]
MVWRAYHRKITKYRFFFVPVGLLKILLTGVAFKIGNFFKAENIKKVFEISMSLLILHNISLFFINEGLNTSNVFAIQIYRLAIVYGIFLGVCLIKISLAAENLVSIGIFLFSASIVLDFILIALTFIVCRYNMVYMQYFRQQQFGNNILMVRFGIIRNKVVYTFRMIVYFYVVKHANFFISEYPNKFLPLLIIDELIFVSILIYFTVFFRERNIRTQKKMITVLQASILYLSVYAILVLMLQKYITNIG